MYMLLCVYMHKCIQYDSRQGIKQNVQNLVLIMVHVCSVLSKLVAFKNYTR